MKVKAPSLVSTRPVAGLFLAALALIGSYSPALRANDSTPKAGLWETVLKNRHLEAAANPNNARYGKNKAPEPDPAGASAATAPAADWPGMIEKVCVTAPALKTVGMPAGVRRDCEYKTQWQGSMAVIHTFCNGVVTSGEVTYSNADSYRGWIHPSAPWGMGRIEVNGRWLGADCGGLKP